jgi:hypothetical protein
MSERESECICVGGCVCLGVSKREREREREKERKRKREKEREKAIVYASDCLVSRVRNRLSSGASSQGHAFYGKLKQNMLCIHRAVDGEIRDRPRPRSGRYGS